MTSSLLFPENLRTIFDNIENEVIWLHGRWIIYRQLYGTNKERIELLNKSASSFFRVVQDLLFEYVLLTLSRLTDPYQSRVKGNKTMDNLSLEQLVKQLDEGKYPDLVKSLKGKLDTLETQCASFRDWRNRKIAHSDLLTELALHPEPLLGVSRSSVEAALQTVRDFMNEFATYFGENHTAYEHFCMNADGNALIAVLGQFWAYREAEEQQWDKLIKQVSNPPQNGG